MWNYSSYDARRFLFFQIKLNKAAQRVKRLERKKGKGRKGEIFQIKQYPKGRRQPKGPPWTWINSHCNSLFDMICVSLSAHTPNITRKPVHGFQELVLSICFTWDTLHFHTHTPPCTHSASNWFLGYMLLLSTRTCWGLFAGMQEMLPTLINMLPTPSQTNSTFEIFPSHQRTVPVPDVGGVEITHKTHRELILAMQTLKLGVCEFSLCEDRVSLPRRRWLEHHHAGIRWVEDRDRPEPVAHQLTFCTENAHVVMISPSLKQKAAPHAASVSACTLTIAPSPSSISQLIDQSINHHINSECEKRTNGNIWTIFISWRCLRTCGLKSTNNRNRSLSKHRCFGWQQVRSTLHFPAPHTSLQVWHNVWRS